MRRSLDRDFANAAFRDINPDIVRIGAISVNKHAHLLATEPLTAGNDFHRLLSRMADRDKLSPKELAYLPWLSFLRSTIWELGAWKMDIEPRLDGAGSLPAGIPDLVAYGRVGKASLGVIEVKIISRGTVEFPRAPDLFQCGAYGSLLAANATGKTRDPSKLWGGVAYVELEARQLRFYGFSDARLLITRSLALLEAA